jgi:alpha-glucosidase
MAKLADPPVFRLAERDGAHLVLKAAGGETAHIFVLEPDIIRVMVLPDGEMRFPRTWAIAPGQADVAYEGRNRFGLGGFSLPNFELTSDVHGLVLTTACLRLELAWCNLRCRWSMRVQDDWLPIAADRPTQAYDFGWWDGRPRHYLKTAPGEAYYGLGERSGPMNRAGRRFRLTNLDAMGYDAETSDPLYKHIPFYMTRTGEGAAFGLFYDTLADCAFDFGCERDNYHGLYRGFVAETGDLDYYVIAGPRPLDVTKRFTWLTGKPARMPDWALAYSGSTMAYTDAPDAQARMGEFLRLCEEHDIPCESFHLSSGYTSIGDKRYVFTWNRDKFPDPAAFVADYAAKSVRLCANIKPCLLRDHPKFAEARERGLLIREPDGSPHWVQFWDEVGAYVDFTNPDAATWWKAQVTESLLDHGVAATWNDNNEYEIDSPRAVIAGFGQPGVAADCKPLQPLLMMRASREAQLAHRPDQRPMVVTRSGAVGMHRYAQTWSGDNTTAWKTLRWNLRMGLGLALSGVSNFGHDIGGFEGPKPSRELFLRWVAAGVLLPRFSIHSWNDDGGANEPWMYPDAVADVRALLGLRHRLAPYLKECLRRYAEDYEPAVRPLFMDFPDDPACRVEQDAFMLGGAVLAAPVVEEGRQAVEVTLPDGADWEDYWTGKGFVGGETVRLDCPMDRTPILLRKGAAIPLNLAPAHFGQAAFERGARVATPEVGRISGYWVEDDGARIDGPSASWRVEGEADGRGIALSVAVSGRLGTDRRVMLVLHSSERRPVKLGGARLESEREEAGERLLEVVVL